LHQKRIRLKVLLKGPRVINPIILERVATELHTRAGGDPQDCLRFLADFFKSRNFGLRNEVGEGGKQVEQLGHVVLIVLESAVSNKHHGKPFHRADMLFVTRIVA
jgi:hypothetical protein